MAGVRIGNDLRSASFAPVTLTRAPGEGAVATFDAGPDAEPVVVRVSEGELSPFYAPSPTWRFGVGARCGMYGDRHMVDSVTIESATFISTTTLPFSVANNGQQFALAEATDCAYYAPPEVSSFSPTSGPAGGGTRSRSTAPTLPATPLCRPTPAASRWPSTPRIGGGGGGGEVRPGLRLAHDCERWRARAARITLNGQQYTRSGVADLCLSPPSARYRPAAAKSGRHPRQRERQPARPAQSHLPLQPRRRRRRRGAG